MHIHDMNNKKLSPNKTKWIIITAKFLVTTELFFLLKPKI